MKKINLFMLMFVIAILLSITVFSQISPIQYTINKFNQITSTITLEEKDTCTIEFYDEVQDVYGTCIYYTNSTGCLNTSGPNTDCSVNQEQFYYSCKTGETTVAKNKTECKPNDEFIISIDKGAAVLKKQIDYSNFGPCIYEEQNSCLVVTCVSMYDGAHKGQFTDCNSGKSCQRFEICDDNINTLYKNSREDFVENDHSFYLDKLAIKEVPE